MEGSSKQSGSSSSKKSNTASKSSSVTSKMKTIFNNRILLKLEEDGFTTPDDKVEKLIKKLTEVEYLYALKLLFDNKFNQFSPKILRDSLVALSDPTFDYYTKQSVARLELHIRNLVAVLEQICFISMRLSKELRDKAYNSLAKFTDIHRKTTQVMQEGIDNKYGSDFYQFNQPQLSKDDEDIIKKRNYNIDFLLIHLRDTLHSLRDDETWFQEVLRRIKELLGSALKIAPSAASRVTPKDIGSILPILNQLRQGLSFKYPVASSYVDWRIMLIIQHNLSKLSENSEISKKFEEMVLMEYFWSYLEREWIIVADKSILDSQSKFDEVSNKLVKTLRNAGSFLNDLSGNEPLTLPHTLWFGILDLAQNLIQKSTRTATYGLCYYLAIESFNKAPSSFIQFKAIEILLHLYNINNELFSMIKLDFDQYAQKLDESNSEKFQNLLAFVKVKCFEDFNILNDNVGKGKEKGKGKSLDQITYIKKDQTSNSLCNVLDIIADEMTCPINSEPTDQLCVLKCQHILSSNNLKKLKQKKCPECREDIEDNDIKYLSQNTIYKNLYPNFFEAGHILPSIELENSDQITNDQYDSDSDNSEENFILAKKKKFIKAMKLNSNISLQSIFQISISKKQHPAYQNAIKELNEKNYEKAEYWCKEFLKKFPKSYSIRCILAYIYRCLNNYEQAYLYVNEAINLKEKNPIAWYIYGEIYFRQGDYYYARIKLEKSFNLLNLRAKIDNLYILLGLSCLFDDDYEVALYYFNIALQKHPNNYLCFKSCAYSYEKYKEYPNTLKMLDKLLNINKEDSLILCYYGEILSIMGRYNEAISYFTEAYIIDPENVHNLNKRAIAYYVLQEYDKAVFDLNKAIKLDFSNSLAYYYKGLTYYIMEDISNAIIAFEKCIELDSNDNLSKMQIYYLKDLMDKNSSKDENDNIITKINQISNIDDDKSLIFIRCKIYIELKNYSEAKSDLDRLFQLDKHDISWVHLLQKYLDFWSYLYKIHNINNQEFTELGIVDKFNIYMYKVLKVYFISNFLNLDSKLCQFQENDSNSLSGQVLSFKGEAFNLNLPRFSNFFTRRYNYVYCKINVKKILSKDCFIKFVVEYNKYKDLVVVEFREQILKYEDLSSLEGLGWIEYNPFNYFGYISWIQLSIEANKNFIDMQIDYVRIRSNYNNREKIIFSKMSHLLPFHKIHPNVPEAFKDRYFPKKEMENLLELKDIINNL